MSNKKNEVAIIIVAYNNADFIIKQAKCIKHFCKDDFDMIVIDNSSKEEFFEAIQYHAINSGCMYVKTQASSKNATDSHAFACNFAYWKFRNNYKYFFFTDHDSFPVKNFSIKKILEDKVMAGLRQEKTSGKKYFWAGCVMFDNNKIEETLVDFSPNNEFGLDTGGNLYKVIEKYGEELCVFFNEAYHQNPNFNKSFYNFYSSINNEMFMHFINGSNWANANDNHERINSLLNILEEKINGKK
jgi:glycosyltransferase involved in cell wall biosynthesis